MKKLCLLLFGRLRRAAVGYMLLGAGAALLIPAAVPPGETGAPEADIVLEEEQTAEAARSGDSITIPGFEVWNVKADALETDAAFYNPARNPCYFVISVTLDDTGETIYESQYIRPGQSLYTVRLSRTLSPGLYPATAHYSTYSVADLSPMNGADVPFAIAAA